MVDAASSQVLSAKLGRYLLLYLIPRRGMFIKFHDFVSTAVEPMG
jgi:hypothetical protein